MFSRTGFTFGGSYQKFMGNASRFPADGRQSEFFPRMFPVRSGQDCRLTASSESSRAKQCTGFTRPTDFRSLLVQIPHKPSCLTSLPRFAGIKSRVRRRDHGRTTRQRGQAQPPAIAKVLPNFPAPPASANGRSRLRRRQRARVRDTGGITSAKRVACEFEFPPITFGRRVRLF